ncbi:MAG TPA: hypothetical protein VFL91_16305 [Thermomicrobiales bacterium]|nr:hypothetical protein [Thermomicrobiales bacterium]
MPDDEERARETLAQKLDHLFALSHPRDRGEYTYEEVASEIRRRGTPLSASYLWMLRKGQQDNPSKRHLEALADFFGVPIQYFFDADVAKEVDAELELLAAVRDAGVREIALRAAELTPAGRRVIAELIAQVRAMEQATGTPGQSTTRRRPRRGKQVDED